MDDIIPIARIEREAIAAARQHSCVNAACPYPFGSAAGRLFKQVFLLAQSNSSTTLTTLTTAPQGQAA